MRTPLRCVTAATIAAAGLVGVACETDTDDNSGATDSDLSTNTENPPIEDVTVAGCNVDQSFGTATVNLRIENHSSKPSDYLVTVGISDSTGARVGDAHGSTQNIAPDAPANTDAVGTVSEGAVGPFECKVNEVERFAS